jgi:DNA-binding FadR family transcriptional regulator
LASNAADARHLYDQVATALRESITRGELEPGEAIPSEAELKAQHGVSRDTVRKALGVLTQEGLPPVEMPRAEGINRQPDDYPTTTSGAHRPQGCTTVSVT